MASRAAATDHFLDKRTLRVADSGGDANSMIGAVVAVSRDTVISMI